MKGLCNRMECYVRQEIAQSPPSSEVTAQISPRLLHTYHRYGRGQLNSKLSSRLTFANVADPAVGESEVEVELSSVGLSYSTVDLNAFTS
jgi:hypothetical protein